MKRLVVVDTNVWVSGFFWKGTQKLGQTDRFFVYRRDVKKSALFIESTEHVTVCRDPKDNQFLDVAVASSAPFLVTGDKDLSLPRVSS